MHQPHTPPRGRLYTVFAIVGIVVVLIITRYASIMLTDSSQAVSAAGPTRIERGPILDRNGRILAIQTELETVWAWRPEVNAPRQTAGELAPLLDLDADSLAERLTGTSGSVTIKRTISPGESEAIREARERGELQGVRLRPDNGRSYPERDSLAPVIGFVGDEGRGLTGIEYTMESWLRPQQGNTYGNQVFLTVDMNIQYESERLAQQALETYDADSVMLLTMDARTGDLLGYASLPSFDPNQFREYSDDVRRNRPISTVYEPGSVFKIFSIGSLLQLGAIDMETTYATTGSYAGTRPPIRDLANYGTIDTTGILRLSSNVGAAIASEQANERSFYNMLRLFGFGEETGIDLNGEEAGLLARPDEWSGRTKPTLAIGQEIAVTAVQLMSAATVYANSGVLIKPNIVDKVVSPSGRVVLDYGRTPVREVLSPRDRARCARGNGAGSCRKWNCTSARVRGAANCGQDGNCGEARSRGPGHTPKKPLSQAPLQFCRWMTRHGSSTWLSITRAAGRVLRRAYRHAHYPRVPRLSRALPRPSGRGRQPNRSHGADHGHAGGTAADHGCGP